MKVSLSYDHWSLRKWRIKSEKFMDFLRQKSFFFLRKKYFDVPHAIGVLGCTFVEPNTPGFSQRGRLLGAVAQWQLRLCFFFSRPFHENFKFLKNCPYDFHEILHSHSTPKGAPACAKASKSYGLDVRNIAKISPKVAKKQPFFDFFRFSQKLSIRFE